MIRAVVLIILRKGKVLFARRSKSLNSLPDRWSLPAEKIIKDESTEDAVKRCAWHELALKINTYELLHEQHFDIEDKTLYFVAVRDAIGEPEIETHELTEIQWLSFGDFFNKYKDPEIGHGLQWIRKHPEIWKALK